jgi:hypothetical protein
MFDVMGLLRKNAAYAFFVVAVAWLAVAVLGDSPLTLWPVGACIVSGFTLRMWPGERFTWAWVVATAVLGFLLSAYQVYAWVPFLGGTFSTLAAASLVGFAIFAVAHAFLFFVALKPALPKAGSP